MSGLRSRRGTLPALAAAALQVGAAGCAPPPATSHAAPAPAHSEPVLPPLAVDEPSVPAYAPATPDPWAGLPRGREVTLSARDVDVRALLIALSEAAGVSLVIDPEVSGRVTVNLVDMPAVDAIRSVLASARLSVAAPPPAAPWEPVAFYVLPVDIERASAALIQARFDVSRELAEWIVENRIR